MGLAVTQAIESVSTGDRRHERNEGAKPSEPMDDLMVIECVEGRVGAVTADLTKVGDVENAERVDVRPSGGEVVGRRRLIRGGGHSRAIRIDHDHIAEGESR